jgi:hypothetical protein
MFGTTSTDLHAACRIKWVTNPNPAEGGPQVPVKIIDRYDFYFD